ncbi:MAG: hypothetical protein IIA17_09990 [candidate division Zixibacteria bacterium]|nr:hypothetical protein [candidate division Zixibacteria bacterium]
MTKATGGDICCTLKREMDSSLRWKDIQGTLLKGRVAHPSAMLGTSPFRWVPV